MARRQRTGRSLSTGSFRDELIELTQQGRAWLEWQHDCGGEALPFSTDLEQVAAQAKASLTRTAGPRGNPAGQAQARQARPSPPTSTSDAARPAPRTVAKAIDVPSSVEARRLRLEAIARETSACTLCSLHEERKQTVVARGNPEADLVFIGEGPGREEDEQGLPFVGPAGQLLDRMIGAMGYQPEDVYVANIVKCRPPNNRKPEPEEMATCIPFLHEHLALVSPKVIVALGATAVQGLLGTTVGITRLRGTWKLYRGRTPVMPTFHPAYLLRQAEKKREVWNDLQQVMKRLEQRPPSADPAKAPRGD